MEKMYLAIHMPRLEKGIQDIFTVFFTIQINSCPCAYSFLIFFKCCSLSDVTNAHVLADLLCGPCDRLNLD